MVKRPTIRQAQTICESLGARAVIVLALSEDGFAVASYGATKAECSQTGHTLDKIVDAIGDGSIPVWEARP